MALLLNSLLLLFPQLCNSLAYSTYAYTDFSVRLPERAATLPSCCVKRSTKKSDASAGYRRQASTGRRSKILTGNTISASGKSSEYVSSSSSVRRRSSASIIVAKRRTTRKEKTINSQSVSVYVRIAPLGCPGDKVPVSIININHSSCSSASLVTGKHPMIVGKLHR
jgi:hypothetical protein